MNEFPDFWMPKLKRISYLTVLILIAFWQGESLSEKRFVIEKPSWIDLQFSRIKDNKLEKIVIELFAPAEKHWQSPISVQEQPVITIVIEDQEILDYISSTIYQVQSVAVDEKSAWLGPWRKVGSMRLLTTENELELGVSNFGFILGKERPDNYNLFYSWALARILEDQCKLQKSSLHKKNFVRLSGEVFAITDERFYLEMKKQMNIKAEKETGEENLKVGDSHKQE